MTRESNRTPEQSLPGQDDSRLEAEIDLMFVDRTVGECSPLDLPVQLQRHFEEIFRG